MKKLSYKKLIVRKAAERKINDLIQQIGGPEEAINIMNWIREKGIDKVKNWLDSIINKPKKQSLEAQSINWKKILIGLQLIMALIGVGATSAQAQDHFVMVNFNRSVIGTPGMSSFHIQEQKDITDDSVKKDMDHLKLSQSETERLYREFSPMISKNKMSEQDTKNLVEKMKSVSLDLFNSPLFRQKMNILNTEYQSNKDEKKFDIELQKITYWTTRVILNTVLSKSPNISKHGLKILISESNELAKIGVSDFKY